MKRAALGIAIVAALAALATVAHYLTENLPWYVIAAFLAWA